MYPFYFEIVSPFLVYVIIIVEPFIAYLMGIGQSRGKGSAVGIMYTENCWNYARVVESQPTNPDKAEDRVT